MPPQADQPSVESASNVSVPKQRLEQLQRIAAVGAVASSVAHEFNNILTTILNYAKMGLHSSDPETMHQAFDKILNSARRAAKITTGVLALSRNRSAPRQATDLAALLGEVIAVVEKDLAKHQVRLEVDVRSRPIVELVAPQIEQVLVNIIINARQAMPAGGNLRVWVDQNEPAGFAEIGIRDTGVGIAPSELPRIFEPFYSTKDGPDQTGQGGSGLGLSICREIVERHQGRIRVESLVGRGTTFTIKLPIRVPQNAMTPAA